MLNINYKFFLLGVFSIMLLIGCVSTSEKEKSHRAIDASVASTGGIGTVLVSGTLISSNPQYDFTGNAVQQGIELTSEELKLVILRSLTQNEFSSASDMQLINPVSENSRDIWTISSSNDGQITTDWKPINGRTAGVLWWVKKYNCEVRHIIIVNKMLNNPNQKLEYKIITEVRERPNENYSWQTADPELGRYSYEIIKNTINSAINRESVRKNY